MQSNSKEFNGEYRTQMSLLVGEGLVPISMRQELERRVDAYDKFKSGKIAQRDVFALFGDYRDTGDGIVRMCDGSVKIKTHSPTLLAIKQNTPLVNYGVGHDADPFPDVTAIPAKIVKSKFNRQLRRGEPVQHEGWLAVAEYDAKLIGAYETAVRDLRDIAGYDAEQAMRFDVHDSTKGKHVERALGLGRFDNDGIYGGGGAFCGGLDDYVYGARLAGVAPEAQSSAARSAVAPTVPSTASVVVAPQMNVNDLVERLYTRLERVPVTRAVSREDLTQGVQEYLATLK